MIHTRLHRAIRFSKLRRNHRVQHQACKETMAHYRNK